MANSDVKAFYNNTMPGKFGDDYEYNRWFKDAIQRVGYDQTKDAITRHVLNATTLTPSAILELGPGAGTWTKLLCARFPDAQIDALDISKEMLARAKAALVGEGERVQYIESDVLDWNAGGEYDLFFSSRVLEYIDDKSKFASQVFHFLAPGGRGFLITKMPHYTRDRLLGRTPSALHQGQIAPQELARELTSAGFVDVQCFPVTISLPLLHSAKANALLGHIIGTGKIGPIGAFFAESYAVTFRKP